MDGRNIGLEVEDDKDHVEAQENRLRKLMFLATLLLSASVVSHTFAFGNSFEHCASVFTDSTVQAIKESKQMMTL